jgi:hypothetical protein
MSGATGMVLSQSTGTTLLYLLPYTNNPQHFVSKNMDFGFGFEMI